MLDILKNYQFLFFSGIISFHIYKYRLKQKYTKLSGERFLALVFLFGSVSQIFYQLAHEVFIVMNQGNPSLSHPILFLLKVLFFIISSIFVGVVTSDTNIQKKFSEENLFHQNNVEYETNGVMEKEFVHVLDKEKKYKFYIFELKNNKFYLAIPAMIDILDDVDPAEKVLKIFPLRSGHRNRDTFNVEYYNEYISEVIQEEIAKDNFSSIAKLKPISIFLREIITYREFDPILFKKFGHSVDQDNS